MHMNLDSITGSMIDRFGPPPVKPLPQLPVGRERAFSADDVDLSSIVRQVGLPPNKPLPPIPQPTIEDVQQAFSRLTLHRQPKAAPLLPMQGSMRITDKEKRVMKDYTTLPSFDEFAKNNFATVTPNKILLMRRGQRQQLKERLRTLPNNPGACLALERINRHEANIKEMRLVRTITEHNQLSWQGLFFANECIIKTDKIFQLIVESVLRFSEEKAAATKLSMLVKFCAEWVEHNRYTSLFSLAEPELRKIEKATKEHPERYVLMQHQSLRKALDQKMDPETLIVHVREQPKARSMNDILGYVKANASRKKWAEILARDLHHFVLVHYTSLTPDHLISAKWPGKKHPAMAQYLAYFNGLGDFILESILSEPAAEKRTQLVKFFIEVAELSFQLRDLTTTYAIFSALYKSSLTRLKKTWEPVLSKPKFSKPYEQFTGLFCPASNLKNLRDYMKTAEMILPYLGMVEKDILPANEMEPVVGPDPTDLSYNFAKLDMIRKIATSILVHQEVLKKKNGWHGYLQQTNIIDTILKQKRISDEWADSKSDELKASEARS